MSAHDILFFLRRQHCMNWVSDVKIFEEAVLKLREVTFFWEHKINKTSEVILVWAREVCVYDLHEAKAFLPFEREMYWGDKKKRVLESKGQVTLHLKNVQ